MIKRILVVDDEKDVQILFEQRFRKEIKNGDFDFRFAFSGEEAISYLANQEREAVLILSDINMPGMSGLELLRILKQKFDHTPPFIMMITAYGDEESYQKAMELGADDFLTKPVDFSALKEILKEKLV
jgi:Response regulator containing CheY-like receiver, AAA-type ATPase, and DNA-binding domains